MGLLPLGLAAPMDLLPLGQAAPMELLPLRRVAPMNRLPLQRVFPMNLLPLRRVATMNLLPPGRAGFMNLAPPQRLASWTFSVWLRGPSTAPRAFSLGLARARPGRRPAGTAKTEITVLVRGPRAVEKPRRGRRSQMQE